MILFILIIHVNYFIVIDVHFKIADETFMMAADGDSGVASDELILLHKRHAKFFQRSLAVLPCSLSSYDTQRVTIAFFALSGLDLLGCLELVSEQSQHIIEWLYSCLVISREAEREHWSGFRGSTTLKLSPSSPGPSHDHDHGHIAMTYTALASLVILGDDLGRVDRKAVLAGVKALQLPDGSFKESTYTISN